MKTLWMKDIGERPVLQWNKQDRIMKYVNRWPPRMILMDEKSHKGRVGLEDHSSSASFITSGCCCSGDVGGAGAGLTI